MQPAQNRMLLATMLAVVLAGCWEAPEPAATSFPLADGGRIMYWVQGAGPDTVIVIAGSPLIPSAVLRHALAPLAPRHTLVHVELRGRGENPPLGDRDSLSLEDDVRQLEAVRAQLGIARPALVGHFYGAAVVAEYARRHPGETARIVLLGPLPLQQANAYELALWTRRTAADRAAWDTASIGGLDQSDPIAFCRQFWAHYLNPVWVDDVRVVEQLAPLVCRVNAAPIARARDVGDRLARSPDFRAWDLVDSMAQLRVPTLVVSGDDEPVRRFLARWWAYSVPDSRLLLVSGADPTFPWVRRAPEVLEALDAFLSGAWPSAAARQLEEPTPDVTAEERSRMAMGQALAE